MMETTPKHGSHAEVATIEVYKCPTCGGALRYDVKTKKLACMWCGNAFDTAKLEPKQVSQQLQGYLCPECGAELMSDDFIAADTCPYCGNNEVAPHRFAGDFRPDRIIPFKFTKKQAIGIYEDYVAERGFLPDGFDAQDIVVSAQGTYVPFWLQDGLLDFDFMYYTDHPLTVPNTMHHNRVGEYQFAHLPADGSKRMPNDLMDSLEPFNLKDLRPFSIEYLPGFVAERYTVGLDETNARVDMRVAVSAAIEAKETIDVDYSGIELDKERFKYTMRFRETMQVLLPVWLIVISYCNKKILVGVNGQTGKVAANLPIDEKKLQDIDLGDDLGFKGKYAWLRMFPSLTRSELSREIKRRRASMQNVEESADASYYGDMTITRTVSDWGLEMSDAWQYRQEEDLLTNINYLL